MAALAAAMLTAACASGSGKPAASARRSPTPAVALGPAATPAGATAVAGALSTPVVAATCSPGDLLRLVDKEDDLPADYVPPDLVPVQPIDASPHVAETLLLRKEANDALHSMLEQARSQHIFLLAQSTYRSYPDQAKVYNDEVITVGKEQADRESARPGHSEHQLGLAIDFTTRTIGYDLNDTFATTPEGAWLAQNAARFGFVQSYPDGKEAITGYEYEPWHYRYVGVAPAQAVAGSKLTLTEWLQPRQLGCQP